MKQGNVKSLPKGWETKKLVDVCIVERGSSPRPIEKYQTDSSEGVNWIKIGDTKNVDKYIYTTREKITKEGAQKSRYVKEGDFILSNSMSFGKPFIMKTDGYIHDGWFALRLHNFIDTEYFYHLLSSPLVNEQFHKLASGSVVKNISGDLVKKVVLPIPPLQEQQRIVAILDEAFSALDKAKANTEQNLKNAKELFESELQRVFIEKGDGWEEKTISELSKNKNAIVSGPFGSNLKVSDYKEEGIPILRLQNIGKGYFIDKDIKYITPEKALELKSHSYLTGDVVLAKLGIPIGKTCIIPSYFSSGIIVADIVRIRPDKEKFDFKYVEYFLNTDISVNQLTKNISGATRPRVNLSDVRNIKINVPRTLKDQQTIVSKLDALREQTKKLEAVYEKKLQDLEELKKSVLSKAFSGDL